jgi:hypothetical protein
MSVGNELFCREDRRSDSGMINRGVESHFDMLHQRFVGSAFFAFRNEEEVAELAFGKSVMRFELLLFLHHDAVGGKLGFLSVLALKSGRIRSLDTGAFRHVPDAVTETSAQFVFGLSLFHPVSFLDKVLILVPFRRVKQSGAGETVLNTMRIIQYTALSPFFQADDPFFAKKWEKENYF